LVCWRKGGWGVREVCEVFEVQKVQWVQYVQKVGSILAIGAGFQTGVYKRFQSQTEVQFVQEGVEDFQALQKFQAFSLQAIT